MQRLLFRCCTLCFYDLEIEQSKLLGTKRWSIIFMNVFVYAIIANFIVFKTTRYTKCEWKLSKKKTTTSLIKMMAGSDAWWSALMTVA